LLDSVAAAIKRMLAGGDRRALAGATNDLISDVSSERWEQFLAARESALQAESVGEDQT